MYDTARTAHSASRLALTALRTALLRLSVSAHRLSPVLLCAAAAAGATGAGVGSSAERSCCCVVEVETAKLWICAGGHDRPSAGGWAGRADEQREEREQIR
jgi:hypothetical protein